MWLQNGSDDVLISVIHLCGKQCHVRVNGFDVKAFVMKAKVWTNIFAKQFHFPTEWNKILKAFSNVHSKFVTNLNNVFRKEVPNEVHEGVGRRHVPLLDGEVVGGLNRPDSRLNTGKIQTPDCIPSAFICIILTRRVHQKNFGQKRIPWTKKGWKPLPMTRK